MAQVILTPHTYVSAPASALSALGEMLTSAFTNYRQTKMQDEARAAMNLERQMRARRFQEESEAQDLHAQEMIRNTMLSEANTPLPGARPTIPEASTTDVPVRSGGSLAALSGQPAATPSPLPGMPPITPPTETKTTAPMTTPGPAPIDTVTIPGINYHGQQVIAPRQYPKLYQEEAQKAQAVRDRAAKLASGEYGEWTDEMTQGLPEAMKPFAPQAGELFKKGDTISKAVASLTKPAPTVKLQHVSDRNPDTGVYREGAFNPTTGETKWSKPIGGGGGTPSPITQSNVGLHGDEFLATVKQPGLADQIRGIADGRVSIGSVASLRKPRGNQESERRTLSLLVQQYDPGWDETKWKSRNETRASYSNPKGNGPGRAIQSINTVIKHFKTLSKSVDELDSSQFKLFNKAWNAGLQNVGDARVNRLIEAADAVANELALIYKGGYAPTKEEVATQRRLFSAVNAPEQLKGVIKTGAELMGGRLTTLEDDWERIMDKPPEKPFVSKRSEAILRELGVAEDAGLPPEQKANSSDPGGLFLGGTAAPPRRTQPTASSAPVLE